MMKKPVSPVELEEEKKYQPKEKYADRTADIMVEIATLFPYQDPIRLADGVRDFQLPLPKVLDILKKLKPHFVGKEGDMIRLAAGYKNFMQMVEQIDNERAQQESSMATPTSQRTLTAL